MMHVRHMNDLEAILLADVLLPFSITTDQVAKISCQLPTKVLDFVCTCLQQRQFDALWHGAVGKYVFFQQRRQVSEDVVHLDGCFFQT